MGRLLKALRNLWNNVKIAFSTSAVSHGLGFPESPNFICPACGHESSFWASSTAWPVMECNWCKLLFGVRKA